MSGRHYCPDCDGFGFIADGVCAGCEGNGTLSGSELRALVLNPPPDLGEIIGALLIFAFLVGFPLAILVVGTSRAVA